jgi:hypothetical protein
MGLFFPAREMFWDGERIKFPQAGIQALGNVSLKREDRQGKSSPKKEIFS